MKNLSYKKKPLSMVKTMIPVVFQEDKIDFKLTSIIF